MKNTKRSASVIGAVYIVIIMLFLYLPILALTVLSFNESKSMSVFTGFSLRWYREMFQNKLIINSVINTFAIALTASLGATAIGTAACLGMSGMKKKSQDTIMAFNSIPMLNADIVTGISLMLTFTGVCIMLSKYLYGFLSSRLPVHICNWIFFVFLVSGLGLTPYIKGSMILLFTATGLFSLGLGMTATGLTIWAKELSGEYQFERTNQIFQLLYSAGSLLFSPLPGLLADRSGGSYVPCYIVFLLCALFFFSVIQLELHRCRETSRRRLRQSENERRNLNGAVHLHPNQAFIAVVPDSYAPRRPYSAIRTLRYCFLNGL